MITAFASYALVCLASTYAWHRRRWLELVILMVPLVYCGYFILSIFIFSFGETMPFTYYNPEALGIYGYVSAMICLHFLSVFAAFLIVGRLDRRSYNSVDLSRVRRLGIRPIWALFCILPTVFVGLAVPVSELWARPRFAFQSDTAHWMRFADLLLFISAIATPFIRITTLKFVTLFAVSAAFLAVGSRSGVVMIFIFIGIEVLILRRHSRLVSFGLLLLAFWLLGVILYLRTINVGGISAVAEGAVMTDFGDIAFATLYGTNYIFNLSFVLIGELIATVETETRWFFYSILPIPSALYDQTTEFDAINRFRTNIPFSGFGYAVAHLGSYIYLSIVFISSTAFLLARMIFARRRDIYEATLCFSFFVFPFLILLQYNLRTGSRLIYVFAFVYFVVAFVRRIKFRRVE